MTNQHQPKAFAQGGGKAETDAMDGPMGACKAFDGCAWCMNNIEQHEKIGVDWEETESCGLGILSAALGNWKQTDSRGFSPSWLTPRSGRLAGPRQDRRDSF